jgi:UDP-2,4-diacetamido-2,4,6-trideoxy-beta-L-altropyranose hydrolase
VAERSNARKKVLVFRCDGGVTSGLGHVSRSVALAEAMAERGVVSLFVGEHSAPARALLQAAGMARRDAGGALGSDADVADLRRMLGADAPLGCVVDSYLADAAYLAALGASCPLVVLDDFAALSRYPCAAIVNVTVTGSHLLYPEGPVRLVGPRYLLARAALRRLGRKAAPVASAKKVLVALGGVDRHGLTEKVLEALARTDAGLSVRVIVRADDARRAAIAERLNAFASARIEASLDDLAEPYAWADACIAGGGLMKYEAGFLGLPVGVLAQSDGEADDVARCVALGFVHDLGGPGAASRPAPTALAALLRDATLRTALHAASADVFGPDPTALVADTLLAALAPASAEVGT